MRTLNGLAWRNLTQRKWRAVLIIAGVALGVSLVFAAGSIAAAANESRNPNDDHINTQIVSSSGSYLETAQVEQARRVPGVLAVSPILSVPGIVSTDASSALTLQGIDPAADSQLHSRSLAQGSLLNGPDQLLVPAAWAHDHHLNIGDRVSLLLLSGGAPLPSLLPVTIVGMLNIPGQSVLSGDGYVPLTTLQQVTGLQGKVSLIEARFEVGADTARVLNSLKDTLGERVGFVTPLELDAKGIIGAMDNVMLVMGGCVILVTAAYLIFNIFAMTLAERRVDVGRLMALGMTPRQATRNMLVEALIIGATGGVVGLFLGAALTIPVQLLIDTGMGQPFRLVPLSPLAGLVSVSVGILVTLAATYPIARQAGKVSPLAMIFSERNPTAPRLAWTTPLGWVLFILGILGWLILFAVSASKSDLAASLSTGMLVSLAAHMLILFGVLLIVPGLLARGLHALRSPVRMRTGLAVSLALSTLQRQPIRAARTASILMIMVAATLMITGISSAIVGPIPHFLRGFLNPDYLIFAKTGDNGSVMMAAITGKLFMPADPRFYTALDALQDKLSISHLAYSIQYPQLTLFPGQPSCFVVDIDTYVQQREAPFVGATVEEVKATFAAGPAIILAQGIADRYKLKVGDTFTLDAATGPIQLRVAAIEDRIYYSYLDYQQVQTALGGISPLAMLLKLKPGVSAADVDTVLNGIASQYGVHIVRMTDVIGDFESLFGSLGMAFSAIGVLTMVIAALGILNTVYTSVIERRRELGVLAAVGGSPVQLRTMILTEAVILGIGGTVPGAIIGALMSASWGPLNAIAAQLAQTDFYGASAIPWLPVAVMLVGAPLIAILAALIPARYITRLQIVEALHYQ